MKENEFLDGVGNIDSDVVERFVSMDNRLQSSVRKRSKKAVYLRIIAVAACLALTVGAIIAVPMLRDKSSSFDDPPVVFDAVVVPEESNGNNVDFIVGSSTSSSSGGSPAPLEFKFATDTITVKARVVKNFPDQYNVIIDSSSSRPTVYRLIQMQTLEVIHGENMPQYFLYLIRDYVFADMSVYDSLLISMIQKGAEHFVLRNVTKNQLEVFELPVFSDARGYSERGSIIPFTDGVFDESLWKYWGYGYNSLDDPPKNFLVKRGASEKDVIAEIRRRTEENHSDYCGWHRVITLNRFESQEAKDAIEYVTSLENGVFVQSYSPYSSDVLLVFHRYVNGCPTDEIIAIDVATEEVRYSADCYSTEEIAQMEDISAHLLQKSKEYTDNTPIPPHIDPAGKKLLCLSLYAWYEKIDGKIYGVLKTSWRYRDQDNELIEFYDEAYILYDISSSSNFEISKEDLTELLGENHKHIYRWTLGEKIEIPFKKMP